MKKGTFCVFAAILTFFLFNSCSNKPTDVLPIGENDWETEALRGRIHKLKTSHKEGGDFKVDFIEFDQSGFYKEKKTITGWQEFKTVFVRKDNKLVSQNEFVDGISSDSIIFYRDANGNLIEEKTMNDSIVRQRKLYGYDSLNRFVLYKEIGFWGDTLRIVEKIYGKDNKPVTYIEIFRLKIRDGIDSLINKKTYNEFGNFASDSCFSHGHLISLTIYEYDELGNLRSDMKYLGGIPVTRNPQSSCSFVYSYDEFGNWIKCETIWDGKVVDETTREITYFK